MCSNRMPRLTLPLSPEIRGDGYRQAGSIIKRLVYVYLWFVINMLLSPLLYLKYIQHIHTLETVAPRCVDVVRLRQDRQPSAKRQ